MTRMRIFAVVLAALLSMAMLAACSGANGTTTPKPSLSAAPGPTRTGSQPPIASGQPTSGMVPRPSHVVIVIEENHSFGDIIGSSAAPYLNSLASQGALFTNSTAVAHPSEPNYLALFSGSIQGITDDSCPHSFDAGNLGSQLVTAGQSFVGYSEGLPASGYLVCAAGSYARKHAPWTNFPSVPGSASQPFNEFPQDYASLPTVSIVVPNLADDMHDGSVQAGDTWLRDHLDGYAQWAKTHNSLLVVTWDEDDNTASNHIATIFAGAQVKPGQYGEAIDHYRVLRTVESAYGLPPLGRAADTPPITDVWH